MATHDRNTEPAAPRQGLPLQPAPRASLLLRRPPPPATEAGRTFLASTSDSNSLGGRRCLSALPPAGALRRLSAQLAATPHPGPALRPVRRREPGRQRSADAERTAAEPSLRRDPRGTHLRKYRCPVCVSAISQPGGSGSSSVTS